MAVATTILNGALDPYTSDSVSPWNRQRVQHLYLRLGYGADLATLEAGLNMSPSDLVDQLIDGVLAQAAPEPTEWAFWSDAEYETSGEFDFDLYFEHKFSLVRRWNGEMISDSIRAKLALFWHNHFVTEEEVYACNSFMWAYYDLLHKRALGNFRTFVEEMGKNPAMLVYLNGNQNRAEQPNENYARELMELFTMGEGNGYTQNDIVEVASALTGWFVNMYDCTPDVYALPGEFDDGQKTIFGQTGNWDYDDVHELIFTLRAEETANYICEKIYKYFVYEKPNPEVVTAMAQCLLDNDWELSAVFRELFKSAHFFNNRIMNVRIKSPLEVLVHLFKLLNIEEGVDYGEEELNALTYYTRELGQEVFNPVDVAGWPEYHTWLNENTLTFRWAFSANYLFGTFANSDTILAKVNTLVESLADGAINDEVFICQQLTEFFLNQPLDEDLQATALQYFKGEVPENYFDDDLWNIYFPETPYMALNLLYYLTRLPEWQLC